MTSPPVTPQSKPTKKPWQNDQVPIWTTTTDKIMFKFLEELIPKYSGPISQNYITHRIIQILPEFSFGSASIHWPSRLSGYLEDTSIHLQKRIEMAYKTKVYFSDKFLEEMKAHGKVQLSSRKKLLHFTSNYSGLTNVPEKSYLPKEGPRCNAEQSTPTTNHVPSDGSLSPMSHTQSSNQPSSRVLHAPPFTSKPSTPAQKNPDLVFPNQSCSCPHQPPAPRPSFVNDRSHRLSNNQHRKIFKNNLMTSRSNSSSQESPTTTRERIMNLLHQAQREQEALDNYGDKITTEPPISSQHGVKCTARGCQEQQQESVQSSGTSGQAVRVIPTAQDIQHLLDFEIRNRGQIPAFQFDFSSSTQAHHNAPTQYSMAISAHPINSNIQSPFPISNLMSTGEHAPIAPMILPGRQRPLRNVISDCMNQSPPNYQFRDPRFHSAPGKLTIQVPTFNPFLAQDNQFAQAGSMPSWSPSLTNSSTPGSSGPQDNPWDWQVNHGPRKRAAEEQEPSAVIKRQRAPRLPSPKIDAYLFLYQLCYFLDNANTENNSLKAFIDGVRATVVMNMKKLQKMSLTWFKVYYDLELAFNSINDRTMNRLREESPEMLDSRSFFEKFKEYIHTYFSLSTRFEELAGKIDKAVHCSENEGKVIPAHVITHFFAIIFLEFKVTPCDSTSAKQEFPAGHR